LSGKLTLLHVGLESSAADQVAKTLELSMDNENFYVLLGGSTRRATCHRWAIQSRSSWQWAGVRNEVSDSPHHTMEAANKRLELRRKLLQEA
jgi:hypothetical protein